MAELVETSAQKEDTMEEMRELYETSMKSLQEGGNILKGKVINVNSDTVIVDVGLKSEGKVPISEFLTRSGEYGVKVGDEVEVMIIGREKEFGLLLLSKQRVDYIRTWQRIHKSFEEGTPIEGDIVSEVNKGFVVDIGVNAFLPISQVDIKPVKNPSSFVGRHLKFKVLKVDQRKGKGNVILSRRVLLEEERERKRAEFWRNAKEGLILYGFVRNITDYGAFIDLGGVDGFLHVNEITWGRISHPKEYLRVGDEIKVKIIEIDQEKEKVSLSMKRLKPDPWEKIDERYPVGSKVKGRVVGIVDYGAFVEIEQGVEGLLHLSEMTYDKKVKNPNKILNKNDWVEVKVMDIDKEKKRISLSLKELLPNPWDEIMNKYPVGSIVKGRVKNWTDFGVFIGIEDGIDGLVHASEVSWSRRKKGINEILKKGATVEAIVLNVDKEQKKFSLSIKRLKKNPWEGVSQKYKAGEIVEGYVTSITDFGVFIEIEDGVEGLLHVSEIDDLQGKKLNDIFNIDDKVKAVILNVDEKEKRISLSTKFMKKAEEKNLIENLSKDTGVLSTLGDILEPAIKKNNL